MGCMVVEGGRVNGDNKKQTTSFHYFRVGPANYNSNKELLFDKKGKR